MSHSCTIPIGNFKKERVCMCACTVCEMHIGCVSKRKFASVNDCVLDSERCVCPKMGVDRQESLNRSFIPQ